MSIKKNIGRNTIGDNNKMSVSLHEYNMSTHDLSTIVRNTPIVTGKHISTEPMFSRAKR